MLRLAEAGIALGAEDLHPAGAAEKILRAGLGGERVVLDDAMLDQSCVEVRDGAMARGARCFQYCQRNGVMRGIALG